MERLTRIEKAKIKNSGDEELIKRVLAHLGPEFLEMSPDIAATFDTGDLYDSDPRSRTSLKIYGEETRRRK